MATDDRPSPHPTSAMRPPAGSATSTSGIHAGRVPTGAVAVLMG